MNTLKKQQLIGFFLITFIGIGYGQNSHSIIPEPLEITIKNKTVAFRTLNVRINHQKLEKVKAYLETEFTSKFTIASSDKTKGTDMSVVLKIRHSNSEKEAYCLKIRKKRIVIEASTAHGVFNGIQSLFQLMYASAETFKGKILLNVCTIKDKPRFAWRGFMLDESRHFFGKEKVLQILDLMALHKLNTFHWHLTDAPGWRIEIKKYPKLTSIGAKGNYSNPKGKAQFYSQKEIKEIVAYASQRFIQIIPEIDMPGHASAVALAYPEYSGGGTKKHPNFTFNPGKEETYAFLTNILREVASLFPAPYIHIGGDEVHYGNEQWNTNVSVQNLMKKEGLKTLYEVEKYFVKRISDSIIKLNKIVVGWDEIAQTGLDKNKSLIMWWRHNKFNVLENALSDKNTVILCPRIPMYFDFVQDKSLKNGRLWAGGKFGDLEQVYNFPDALDIQMDFIKGVQANLWSERYESAKSLDFAIWPRVSALSEAGWAMKKSKNFSKFKNKLKYMYKIYDRFGLYYFDVFNPKKHAEPKRAGKAQWQLNHTNY